MQPPILPRPDVARLGIAYRRIPIMAIGRDVYLDTRLIIQKLEELFPAHPRLGTPPSHSEHVLIERLLEALVIDGGVFARAAQLLPSNLPLLRDPKFLKDRADYRGGEMLTRQQAEALRPEAVNELTRVMGLLEATLLADGRDWLLKTESPGLADLEVVWPLHWMVTMPGALPAGLDQQFPKVHAWINRFAKAAEAAGKAQGRAPSVSGAEAEKAILDAPYNEIERGVDASEPLAQFHGLQKGLVVRVWPIDSGSAHKDQGDLVSLDSKEVVIETKTAGGAGVRVHAPRHGFRIAPASGSKSNL